MHAENSLKDMYFISIYSFSSCICSATVERLMDESGMGLFSGLDLGTARFSGANLQQYWS